MILKYLKDQGGQFWGAFAQGFANSVKEAQDRPLKEAMMKAQIAHQQAVADKAQMDVQQAQQQQQAVSDLASILQPKPTTPAISEAPAPVPIAPSGNIPTLTPQMTVPDIKSPEVMSKLAQAQPKEFTAAVLKQAINPALAGGAIVNTWEEARHLQNDPEFQAANPYGGRWQVNAKGQIQFQGIHPVNPEAAIFHGGGGTQGSIDYAYNRGASAAAGGAEGKAAQQVGQPIAPRVPFAGQQPQPGYPVQYQETPQGQPTPGQPTAPAAPTESNSAKAKRMQQQITRQEGPIPEADKNALNAASKISAQADLLLKGFSDEEINKFSGVFNQPKEKGKSYVNAATDVLGMGKPFQAEDRNRFSAWQTALGQLKHVAFDEGGKQLTPFEASIVFSYIPTGGELNGGVEIKQKIEQLKAFLEGGRAVRAKLAQAGRSNIDPVELDKIMQEQLGPLVQKLKAGQTGGNAPSGGGESVIHHPTGDYIVRGNQVFKVK